MTIEQKLTDLGLSLPAASTPQATYVPYKQVGDILYISGQLPFIDGALETTGLLGANVSIEQGQHAARHCLLNILAQAKAALGSLDNIAEVVKLGAFVASTADFTAQPTVVNGASDLLVELMGEPGKHARFAVGAAALPLNTPVEIEAVIRVK